jgi:hypothetical protein
MVLKWSVTLSVAFEKHPAGFVSYVVMLLQFFVNDRYQADAGTNRIQWKSSLKESAHRFAQLTG